MSLVIPDEILQATRMSEAKLDREIAVLLFPREKLVLGQPNRLAGIDRQRFQRLLAGRRIPVHPDVAEFASVGPAGRRLRRRQSMAAPRAIPGRSSHRRQCKMAKRVAPRCKCPRRKPQAELPRPSCNAVTIGDRRRDPTVPNLDAGPAVPRPAPTLPGVAPGPSAGFAFRIMRRVAGGRWRRPRNVASI